MNAVHFYSVGGVCSAPTISIFATFINSPFSFAGTHIFPLRGNTLLSPRLFFLDLLPIQRFNDSFFSQNTQSQILLPPVVSRTTKGCSFNRFLGLSSFLFLECLSYVLRGLEYPPFSSFHLETILPFALDPN